jgi:hypothetical protein
LHCGCEVFIDAQLHTARIEERMREAVLDPASES